MDTEAQEKLHLARSAGGLLNAVPGLDEDERNSTDEPTLSTNHADLLRVEANNLEQYGQPCIPKEEVNG